jgi:hypothetical protein
MSEPHRHDAAPDGEAVSREARIEQLLVAGLDHYFTGHYEQAINIWTRVIFLDRRHSRARAYIERARSALAERQRECEELVHGGVDAYNAGQLERARELLTRAVDRGGPSDTAMLFLDRLNRADAARPLLPAGPVVTVETASAPEDPGVHWPRTLFASACAVGVVLLLCFSLVTWLTGGPDPDAQAPPERGLEPLPIARSWERDLDRARALVTAGRPREALAVLDALDASGPVTDRETLRAEAQRRVLLDVPSGPGSGDRP